MIRREDFSNPVDVYDKGAVIDSLYDPVWTSVRLLQRGFNGVYAAEDVVASGEVLKNEWMVCCISGRRYWAYLTEQIIHPEYAAICRITSRPVNTADLP